MTRARPSRSATGSNRFTPPPASLWNKSRATNAVIKFVPRRGPSKLKFPLPGQKALRLLTQQPTTKKATTAYRAYLVALQRKQRPQWPLDKIEEWADSHMNWLPEKPCSEKDFWERISAFGRFPRVGFRPWSLEAKEEILKKLCRAGLKCPARFMAS